jgi:thiamine-phosphate pyrophosphorylase
MNDALNDEGKLMRLLDANLNRAREALRTVEDAFRFIEDDAIAQAELKRMRHSILRYESLVDPDGTKLLANRASDADVGAFVNPASEMNRDDITAVVRSNIRRAQEALRCLEEYGKLVNAQASGIAKRLRFDAYSFEKKYGLASGSERAGDDCREE